MKLLIVRISVCLGLFLVVTACKKENKSGASPVSPADPNASLGPLSPAATASHILFGYKAYNSSGEVVEGTVSTPIASQICATETILGVTGTAACSLAFGSRGHRTPGSATERAIPVVATDDDGMGDVTPPNTSAITSCGDTQATVAARIAHCNYSWDGEALGKMGEGKWSLVTKANGHEVWKDERTGMLWSGGLGSFNWCQAAGNTENDGGIDCSAGNGLQPDPAVSVCAESEGLNSDDYDDPKGGMRKTATGTSPSVSWRLPTRNDYLQAYANGMGYVLPNFLDNYYWTASVYSGFRGYA